MTLFLFRIKKNPKNNIKFHSDGGYSKKSVYKSDREIFDFTDSRFIRPYDDNGINYPTFPFKRTDDDVILQENSVKNIIQIIHIQ